MRKYDFYDYRRKNGSIPTDSTKGIRESFWCGYFDIGGWRRGKEDSIQRRAYEAGMARSKIEPNLYPTDFD